VRAPAWLVVGRHASLELSSATYSGSNPCVSTFKTWAFSDTVRCTCSGVPSGISASISIEILSLDPGSPARWLRTSSAILPASRPTRIGSSFVEA
jgi:hypothetical protein